MSKETNAYLNPTLWRTCRALANARRLRVFRTLLRENDLTVSTVAKRNGISEVSATQCLRALNSRGLLGVRRVSRWVKYRVAHDPSVRVAEEFVSALRLQLLARGDVIGLTIRDATAFTHPRRIVIFRSLDKHGELSFADLMAITGISEPAMSRHLMKLKRRRFVYVKNGTWFRGHPKTRMAALLTKLACA